jgi:hypothetical protein
VGGMATSTLLSLLYVPVAYTYFDSLSTLVGTVFSFRVRWPFRLRSAEAARRPTRNRTAPLPVVGGASVAAERVQAARGQQRRGRGRGPALAAR